jgi:hypothetical protein
MDGVGRAVFVGVGGNQTIVGVGALVVGSAVSLGRGGGGALTGRQADRRQNRMPMPQAFSALLIHLVYYGIEGCDGDRVKY